MSATGLRDTYVCSLNTAPPHQSAPSGVPLRVRPVRIAVEVLVVQGYFAHKKQPPPRALQ